MSKLHAADADPIVFHGQPETERRQTIGKQLDGGYKHMRFECDVTFEYRPERRFSRCLNHAHKVSKLQAADADPIVFHGQPETERRQIIGRRLQMRFECDVTFEDRMEEWRYHCRAHGLSVERTSRKPKRLHVWAVGRGRIFRFEMRN